MHLADESERHEHAPIHVQSISREFGQIPMFFSENGATSHSPLAIVYLNYNKVIVSSTFYFCVHYECVMCVYLYRKSSYKNFT